MGDQLKNVKKEKTIWTLLCPKQKVKLVTLIIILTMGVWGWTTFSFIFPPMYQESQKVWESHLQRQNKDNGIGDRVEQEESKTQSFVPTDRVGVHYAAPGDEEAQAVSSPNPTVEEIIYEVAKQKQFNDPALLVRIAKAESSLNTCARNSHSSATGLYQILDMHGLTVEERCNPRIATAWTIDKINKGGISAWNESRNKWDI